MAVFSGLLSLFIPRHPNSSFYMWGVSGQRVSFLSPSGNRRLLVSLQDSVPKLIPCFIPGDRWLLLLLVLSSSALSLDLVAKGFLPSPVADVAYAGYLCKTYCMGRRFPVTPSGIDGFLFVPLPHLQQLKTF